MIKSLVRSFLQRYGYTLVRLSRTTSSAPRTMSDVLLHVSRLGFRPQTVIDVGVASGTPPLYETFPDAFHLMIEPLAEFTKDINSLLRSHPGKLILAAASSTEGEVEIHVHSEHLDGSSTLEEQMGPEFDGVLRTVQTITVDKAIADEQLRGPYLLKVDVQGGELDVLRGAGRMLEETELVLVEVSLFEFLKGSPQFFDVVAYMKNLGFVVYDIYGETTRPLDGALGQCDLAFVKENGVFRRDHRYATAEQWRRLS